MGKFLHYLEPKIPIDERFTSTSNQLGVSELRQKEISTLLEPLRLHDVATYEHSIRVGLLAQQIGKFVYFDRKALWYAGLLHDIGKIQTKLSTLEKTDDWTEEDSREIMNHVNDGYRIIRDKFDFTAQIILWHHRFQSPAYPAEMPSPSRVYPEIVKEMIPKYGRMLALADVFDALHRVNSKCGQKTLDGEQIQQKMLERNPDQRILVSQLFDANIFTTHIVPE